MSHYAAEEVIPGSSEGLVVGGDNVAEASDGYGQHCRNVEAGPAPAAPTVATA